jgi:hypothetical protein
MSTKNTSDQQWTAIADLKDSFNDAVNYRSRQEKEFFNKIFVRTDDLTDCLKSSVYYLIGEKGSGKTAYATYLENNEVQGARCKLSTMTETQYKRFIALKKLGKLEYSDYSNIWRPMLLHMVAQALVQKSKGVLASITGKFDAIEEEIGTFNKGSLNPEVEVAFELVSEQKDSISLGNDKFGKLGADDRTTLTDKAEQIKHHLLEKEMRLKHAIADLRLTHNHVLFMDGIDYRPEGISYADYLNCVKGLGEAVWQLNTEFFNSIRDSKGRIKVVLLVRPDVFHSLNLYNSNSRVRDNAVLLDWSTTETAMKASKLYEAAGKYFSSQQSAITSDADAANHYLSSSESDIIFRRLLRTSFQKPRDLLTFITIAKNVSWKRLGRGQEDKFRPDIVKNPDFTKEYAGYLLGEVLNYAAFYMSQEDFFLFIKFFQYLDGKAELNYSDFKQAFSKFKNWIRGENVKATEYLRDAEALLQFFYDVNIIGYTETVGDRNAQFIHFSFRERTITNIAPKIKIDGSLIINPGISKALDIGMKVLKDPINVDLAGDARKRRNDRAKPFHQSSSGKASTTTRASKLKPATNVGVKKPTAFKNTHRRNVKNTPKES